MIQRLVFNAPANALSIGQVSFNILRELYKRKIQVAFFPIGNVDFSAYRIDPQFGAWIEQAVNNRYQRLDRKVPTLKVWHIRDGEARLTDRQYLLTWHETDSPQPAEIALVNHQDATLFTSSWSVDNFRTFGATNVDYVPLGIDEDFTPINQRLISPDSTHWIMVGKHEGLRKMTDLKVQTWIKRYGRKGPGKRFDHTLTLCINNPFYRKQQLPDGRIVGFDMNDVYARMFGSPDWQNAKPDNVNVLPHLKTNAEMVQLYRSADVDLSGFSRAEGANIPAMTATALGKWSIVSDCSAHKDWATAENSILVPPSGMIKAVDGLFFHEKEQFSVGNMFDFAPDAFDQALVRAEKVAKTPNHEGAKLRETHTYAKTVDQILAKIRD